jgi:hypothetical protein
LQDPANMYPNRNFWFENIPSGNPGIDDCGLQIHSVIGLHTRWNFDQVFSRSIIIALIQSG